MKALSPYRGVLEWVGVALQLVLKHNIAIPVFRSRELLCSANSRSATVMSGHGLALGFGFGCDLPILPDRLLWDKVAPQISDSILCIVVVQSTLQCQNACKTEG